MASLLSTLESDLPSTSSSTWLFAGNLFWSKDMLHDAWKSGDWGHKGPSRFGISPPIWSRPVLLRRACRSARSGLAKVLNSSEDTILAQLCTRKRAIDFWSWRIFSNLCVLFADTSAQPYPNLLYFHFEYFEISFLEALFVSVVCPVSASQAMSFFLSPIFLGTTLRRFLRYPWARQFSRS